MNRSNKTRKNKMGVRGIPSGLGKYLPPGSAVSSNVVTKRPTLIPNFRKGRPDLYSKPLSSS
ncbi:hypothetical protein PsorP6_003728 [Peronosclerospora sorghi]|uniref:Uncharacterized protein n=1 Tax=Peronosclerospora sorghi TaxID=230839 RepID=A0ACC0VP51_9STRA|nr:hypothetical protein PsorP6_003728 [Peronosclerospora sorghi]